MNYRISSDELFLILGKLYVEKELAEQQVANLQIQLDEALTKSTKVKKPK